MVAHAGICGACQKDIIKQVSPDTIHCPTCKTVWSNKFIKTQKHPRAGIEGYPCNACGKGMLVQKYWNIIYCDACNTQWKSFKNRFFNGRAQLRTELARI